MPSEVDDEDEFRLQPEQGKSPEERERFSTFLPRADESQGDATKERLQFPIASLMVITGFCAFGLMAANWDNQKIFAGVLGFPALFAAWILATDPPESWQMQSICWGLLLSYALACIVALVA